MSEVLVIGHRNPDTDAICSALGYAEFKRLTGLPGAVAARCGDTNERIDFVLKTFAVAPPRFVADVSPKIRDVMQTHVVSVSQEATVAEALGIMDDKSIRVLPILNEDRTCRGLVSVFKMSKFFFPAPNRPFDSRRVLASIRHLAPTLNAKFPALPCVTQRDAAGLSAALELNIPPLVMSGENVAAQNANGRSGDHIVWMVLAGLDAAIGNKRADRVSGYAVLPAITFEHILGGREGNRTMARREGMQAAVGPLLVNRILQAVGDSECKCG